MDGMCSSDDGEDIPARMMYGLTTASDDEAGHGGLEEDQLHKAVLQGDIVSFMAALDGADDSWKVISRVYRDGDTVFHLAARKGRVDFLKIMVERGVRF